MHINDDTRAELAKRKIGHLKKILCHFLEKFTTRTFIHIKRERESFRLNYTNNNFTTTFCIKLTTTFFTGARSAYALSTIYERVESKLGPRELLLRRVARWRGIGRRRANSSKSWERLKSFITLTILNRQKYRPEVVKSSWRI